MPCSLWANGYSTRLTLSGQLDSASPPASSTALRDEARTNRAAHGSDRGRPTSASISTTVCVTPCGIVVGALTQPPGDQDWIAALQRRDDIFGKPPPAGDIQKDRLTVTPLVLTAVEDAGGAGHAQLRERDRRCGSTPGFGLAVRLPEIVRVVSPDMVSPGLVVRLLNGRCVRADLTIARREPAGEPHDRSLWIRPRRPQRSRSADQGAPRAIQPDRIRTSPPAFDVVGRAALPQLQQERLGRPASSVALPPRPDRRAQ